MQQSRKRNLLLSTSSPAAFFTDSKKKTASCGPRGRHPQQRCRNGNAGCHAQRAVTVITLRSFSRCCSVLPLLESEPHIANRKPVCIATSRHRTNNLGVATADIMFNTLPCVLL